MPLWNNGDDALAGQVLTLQSLAADYQAAVAASLADRAALHGSIDTLAAQLTAEILARTTQDTTLTGLINAEADIRAAALTTEVAARTAQDTTLAGQIANEITARAAAVSAEAGSRASADTAEATVRAGAITALSAQIEALQVALTALKASQITIRTAVVALPLLILGTTDVPVTWSPPMPNATYTPLVTLEGGTTILGKLTAVVKTGSRTAGGCTLSLTNTGLVTIAAGAGWAQVLAYTPNPA